MVDEVKREKFLKITKTRVNKILNYLALLNACTNSMYYDWEQYDIDNIIKPIEASLSILKQNLNKRK